MQQRKRGGDQQLLLLYCFSDVLLMQESCGCSKSYSKNMLSWAHFADASGGKGNLKVLSMNIEVVQQQTRRGISLNRFRKKIGQDLCF